jgi:SAM-dependent methyltransferase
MAAKKQDVVFNAAMHLRLLLRVDRTLAIQQAIRSAIKPGARVLDAGCGSGILSFLALAAGASEVVAVDRDNVDLARALARENGLDRGIHFIEADLDALEPADLAGKFDAILGFIYTNHIAVDEARSRTMVALRQRFGAAACVTVPNKVRYHAIACDWPQQDAATELADLRQSLTDIESRYALKFGPLLEAVTAEVLFDRARPTLYGDYKWLPGSTTAGYHHRRGEGRFLSGRSPVAEIAYDRGGAFDRLPERVTVELHSAGTVTAIMWVQELWFDDMLIWTTEAFSPVATAVAARAGQHLNLMLDSRWRRTNLLRVEPS